MSLETARKAVDLLFQSPAKDIKVEFQGGEPLLAFDQIKFIVELINQQNSHSEKNIQFVVASNLSLLTNDILGFLSKHNICVSTSLDGPEFLHNANRPRPGNDSYARMISNLQRARAALGHDRVSALMTTTQLSLKYPKDIVDEYVRQGFDSIFLRSISPYGFAKRSVNRTGHSANEFLKFYREALDYILSINKQGRYLAETYAQILLTKILTPWNTGYVDLQSPSGLGIGVVVYNYDGDVYASDESRMLAQMGDREFKLGNVHENTYEEIFGGEKLKAIVTASCIESLPGCADCAFQNYCGSDPVFNYAVQGSVFGHRPTSEFCSKNMAIIKYLIEMIENADSRTQEVLWSWIRNVRIDPLNRQEESEALQ
jgi:His-Xaa-Ser system radical SAM maturase HxsB